jgi:hypothetical protein
MITKSAKFHEIFNELLGIQQAISHTTFVIASPEVGGIMTIMTTCK